MTFWACWLFCAVAASVDILVLKKPDSVWVVAMFIMLGLHKWKRDE
jgi:hypothetical protein